MPASMSASISSVTSGLKGSHLRSISIQSVEAFSFGFTITLHVVGHLGRVGCLLLAQLPNRYEGRNHANPSRSRKPLAISMVHIVLAAAMAWVTPALRRLAPSGSPGSTESTLILLELRASEALRGSRTSSLGVPLKVA